MNKLEKAYYSILNSSEHSNESIALDSRINIIVAFVFLAALLSVPLDRLSMLIWFALYPIVASAYLGLSFGKIFIRSLYILPIVIIIGIFNPLYERESALSVGDVEISVGWISFTSIILRGLLAMQSILILISSSGGFIGLCRALHSLGVPSFLTDQLQFVNRYISVLLLEAISMHRAREARGYGKKKYPIKLWGIMIGQLFIRTIDRSERINRAMLSRGFSGTLPQYVQDKRKLKKSDIIYLLISIASIASMRFINLSGIFFSNFNK